MASSHRRHWEYELTDPNLTEPKAQDALNTRRRRPRAARRELQSAPTTGCHDDEVGHQEMTQIRYFKYVPYRGMSEPERRKYLSLGPARLTSSRTEPTLRSRHQKREKHPDVPDRQEASFWPSASKAKSLKVFNYHLAELSLAYRSPPSLLGAPRRLATPTGEAGIDTGRAGGQQKSLFYQMHVQRTFPASAPSATHQHLLVSAGQPQHHQEEKTTQVSRGGTPFIESALSDNFPTEPCDIVSKSASNRLLNVVSVDECHVRLRRRRRRLRRVERPSAVEGPAGDGENEEEEEDYDEEEGEEEGDWGEEEAADEAVVIEEPPIESQAPAEPVPPVELNFLQSSASTRPATERSKKSKRRSEQDMRRLAAAKFLRRNELLREKMAIYLDWKLNQERMGFVDVREGGAGSRFERFTVELVTQEALVANQYRGGGGGGGGGALTFADDSPAPAAVATRMSPEQLSLTEMFEALNV